MHNAIRSKLFLAKPRPAEWSQVILELSSEDPALARRLADETRDAEIESGYPNKALLAAAVDAIAQIDYMTGASPDAALRGPVRSAHGFYGNSRPVRMTDLKQR